MADPIVQPIDSAAPSLAELRRATGVTDAPARPSREAVEVIKRRFPDATPEQVQALAPRVERLLPTLRKKAAERKIPTIQQDLPTMPPVAGRPNLGASTPEGRAAEVEKNNRMLGAVLPTVGATVGAALAPAGFLATSTGSVVGAGLGELVNQFTSNGEETLEEKGEQVLKTMAAEGAAAGAVRVLGTPFRMLAGNRAIREEAIGKLTRFGINPALQDVSDAAVVEGGRRILGAFPLLSKPFRRRVERTIAAFGDKTDDLVGDLSPDTLIMRRYALRGDPTSAARINEKLATGGFEALGEGYEVMRRLNTQKFEAVKRAALNANLPASKLGRTAAGVKITLDDYVDAGILERTSRKLKKPIVRNGVRITHENGYRVTKAAAGTPAGKAAAFVANLAKQKPTGSFSGLLGMKRLISSKIDELKEYPAAHKALTDLKAGLEEDIEALLSKDPQLAAMYADANATSSEFINLLGELVGRRTARYQRGAGREAFKDVGTGDATVLKNAGFRDPIEIIDQLSRTGSPKELDQLYQVIAKARGDVGAREIFGDVLARKLSVALDRSIKKAIEKGADPSFSPANFRKLMGLDDPGSPTYAATVKMFEKVGMDPRRATDVADVMQILFGPKSPRVSDFVARRGLLGGAKSILSGVSGGLIGASAATGGMLGPATFFVLGRAYGSLLTRPNAARAFITAANVSAQESARARALVSLLTDTDVLAGLGAGSAWVAEEAINALQTPAGRKKFFEDVDREYDFSSIGKRGKQ